MFLYLFPDSLRASSLDLPVAVGDARPVEFVGFLHSEKCKKHGLNIDFLADRMKVLKTVPVYPDEPVLRRECLLQVREVKVRIADHRVSGAVVPGRGLVVEAELSEAEI